MQLVFTSRRTATAGRWSSATWVRCACCPPTASTPYGCCARRGVTAPAIDGSVAQGRHPGRFGFARLDTATALVPALLILPRGGRADVVVEPGAIAGRLRGQDLEIFRDHQHARVARHVVLERGSQSCYVIWRRDRRKGLSLFASLLHASDPAALTALLPVSLLICWCVIGSR